jgi:hypothetical protein
MVKKCKTGKFHHGDCVYQGDGVGAMNANLIVLLLLPFSSLHEPIAQYWVAIGFQT